jgi:1-acyl-sn-glycerol-3-phosphate acyltransferase
VIYLRSLIYVIWLYGLVVIVGLVGLPFMLASRHWALRVTKIWAAGALWGLKIICGLKIEYRGLEHQPKGGALMAGKHLSMLDTIVPFGMVDRVCFVLKKELAGLPIFGWYILRTRMIPIAREDAAKALKAMVTDSRDRIEDGRQILIFPEGTRAELGVEGDYKPGIAALYRDLNLPCHLIATNSGQFWPAHGILRKPGTVVFEFLPPIEAGLKRGEFMSQLKDRLETVSKALVDEQASKTMRL